MRERAKSYFSRRHHSHQLAASEGDDDMLCCSLAEVLREPVHEQAGAF